MKDGYGYVKSMPLPKWREACEKAKEIINQRQETPNLVTIRELSKELKIPQKAVLVLIEDIEYIVNVGFMVFGSGHGEEGCQGDWTVESN